jgi:FRG domain
MAWPTQRIKSWDEFQRLAGILTVTATPLTIGFLFRGQADAEWSLEPTIARLLRGEASAKAIELEKLGVAAFEAQAHLYLSDNVVSKTTDMTGWWSLMQHYGAPTRLLDWTVSAYVAAYFAVVHSWDRDGAVWLFGVKDLNDGVEAKYGKQIIDARSLGTQFNTADAPPAIMVAARKVYTERMIAQQGGFSVCRQPLADHAVVIDEILSAKASLPWTKLIIPKELKPTFLHFLRSMNIAANALFPGIDGIGRSVEELYRVVRLQWIDPNTGTREK